MAKDPAFLFYSKDWLEGTAELMPAEKGVYVDLLCHQHQKGSLPAETQRLARLASLSHDEFLKIWETLKSKFTTTGERTLNKKLNDVMSERSANAFKNKIIGIFSVLIRKSEATPAQKNLIKKAFRVDDFTSESNETVNERINEWFNERIASLENADEDGNADGLKNKKEPKKKIEIVFPFPSAEFSSTWNKWLEYRREINKPYRSALSEKAALAKLGIHPESIAIEMIENSIANGWQGIFELKNNGKNVRSANQRTTESVSAGQEGFGSFG